MSTGKLTPEQQAALSALMTVYTRRERLRMKLTPRWLDEYLYRRAVRLGRDLDDDDDDDTWPPDDLYDFENRVILRQGGFIVVPDPELSGDEP